MFGSKQIKSVANEFKSMAQETQSDIDALKSQNPFDTAAAKSAMVKASQQAQNYYNRNLNAMGANASPEAQVSAQGAATQGVASAAGEIATGAEANQTAQLNALNVLKNQQMSQYGQARIDATKTAWSNFFNTLQAAGGVMSGAGQAAGQAANMSAMSAGGSAAAGGSAEAAALLASDRRLKENIVHIGTLQGQYIYKFNYIGSPQTHIGVMAQDIEEKHPDCVVETSGYKFVNYDKLFKEE